MHHLPRIFDLRKQSKKMEQTESPRKLYRKNAIKNFNYTPSPSSTSPSTCSSPAHRARAFDLPCEVDRTSFRIDGNGSEVNSVIKSLGLSGPEDFEIPKAAWEAMKSRSPSGVTLRPNMGYNKPDETQNEEVQKVLDTLAHTNGNGDQMNGAVDVDTGNNKLKLFEAAVPPSNDTTAGAAGKGGGIKGDRPPLLTPPPAMSLPIIDHECSTWDLVKGLAPDGHIAPLFSYHDASHLYENEEEGDGESAQRDRLNSLRAGELIICSGSCSFTTTNDDDSSSTTTEPVSIISPNSGCRLNITHWDKGMLLGRGSFGTVYEGISSEGVFFAVKEVSLLEQGSQGKQSIYYLEQEIDLLSRFEHENIVRYLGTDKDDSKLYIFLELVTQGSLASLYQKYHLRDSHVSNYTRQILLGLKYLHEKDVIHRDVKCANILVASDGTVKLADFGLAKATKLNDLKSCKGTAFWMAPEVVNHKNKGYGLAADIWSLGCTVLEMLSGHVPYYPLEFMQALFRIGKGDPPPIPDSLSGDAKDLIQQCLRVNPNDRPTAAELLDHPFVRRPLYAPAGSESPMPGRL